MSVRSTWRSRAGLTVAGAAVAATALSTAAPASAADPSPVDVQVICDGVGEDTVTVTGDLASGGSAAIASGPLSVVGRPGFTGTDASGRAVSIAPTGDGVTCTARSTISASSLREVLPSAQAAKGGPSSSVRGHLTFRVTVDADPVNTAAARRAEASGQTTTAAASAFPFESALRTYLAGRPGAVGVAVRVPGTSRLYTYTKTNARNVTASIVKAEIMAAVMMRAQDAGRSLTAWEKSKIVPMIRYSDNAATTDLFNSLGGRAALDRASARLGMTATYADPGGRWGLTSTVPQDQARLMEHFARATGVLTSTHRSYGLTLMRSIASDQDWGVTAGAPSGTVALKNGWLPRTDGWHVNSIGSSTSGQDYTIGVLTHDNPGAMGTQITTIEGVSRIVQKYKDRLVPAPLPARGRLGDVDGDGRTDLVGVSASGTMYVYRGDGRGGLSARTKLKAGPTDATWFGGAGDLNRDKRADLLVRRADGRLQLWMSSGTGYASGRTIATGWGGFTGIAAGTDVDRDGRLDVVTRSANGSATLYSLSDSGSITRVRSMGKPFVYYQTLLPTADLDGDGRGDIRALSDSGRLRAWRSTGTAWSMLTATSPGWDRYDVVASPGDLDGSSTKQSDLVGLDGSRLFAHWGSTSGGRSSAVRLAPTGSGMVHLF
ncbi:hypothetical protein AWH69_04570 [Janibacter melonis]|uniref:Beta-lactamase class A catalytic domain-containing protein n=1 Tax=Janibacter melonis TaxID=262209 RepID=A0A176QH75_9MICO|nr:FG-GAP-like repeat-containing protein [Janibacter melonis]OAB89032.1 hypothetical protein AWH69_04570 [Janibacter melonis]